MKKRERPIIAIDGPAGAGKSTTAKEVAKRLNYILVDTGALYRAVALMAKENKIAWGDQEKLAALAAELKLKFERQADGSIALFVNGSDCSLDIRSEEISKGASQVSAHPAVRRALLGIQRSLGAQGGVVLEGRDIGTVVFPDAEIKIFLTADNEERARRRVGDLTQRGQSAEYQSVLEQLNARDHADSTRDVAPLKAAADAEVLDTTKMSAEQVVQHIIARVDAHLART